MEFSPRDMLSPNDILSEVLMYTGEQRYENVTKGFIVSQMNKCLEALSYNTFFNETHMHFDLTDKRLIEIPAGVFNIKQVYLFNGDECHIGENTANVYWKRNFVSPKGNGSVSRNKGNNGNNGADPFYSEYNPYSPIGRKGSNVNIPGKTISNTTFFYGQSNGNLMFSPNCSAYSKVLIKFSGVWQFDDETPTIPRVTREVLVDWCTESVFRAKIVSNPESDASQSFRTLQKDAELRLGYKPETFHGSWYKAKSLLTRMGSKKKEDLKEYLSRLNS